MELTELGEDTRSLRLTPAGERYVRLVEEIAKRLSSASIKIQTGKGRAG